MDSAVPVSALAAPLKLALDRLKSGRRNDGLMVSFHIILRNFAVVPLLLFCEKIDGIAFLQERVALVLFVFEHVPNGPGVPLFLMARRRNAISGELAGNAVRRHAL